MSNGGNEGVTGLRGAWAARTPDAVAVVWDRPEGRPEDTFRVLVDDPVVGTTSATDDTVTGLTPGTTCRIGVTVRQSPAWCVHVSYCAEVTLDQVAIYTKYDGHGVLDEGIGNGDAFDPGSTDTCVTTPEMGPPTTHRNRTPIPP